MVTEAPQTVVVDKLRVSCDGGGVSSGHPRVWLQIPNEHGWVECPYCDTRFVYENKAEKAK